MSEAMGLITGAYDAKAGGFAPGALSLHNRFTSHGPDLASWRAATDADLKPHKIDNTMAFMVESRWPLLPTKVALASPALQSGYDSVWDGFPKARLGDAKP
jgi:homogentisate 1,2-dioxygenase